MSAVVKLSTQMPGDNETNGIDAQAAWLLDNPKELLVCAVWVDVQKTTIDTDSGEHIPTIRVRRIEPLGETGAVSQAIREAVGLAIEERTGRTPIPFDIAEITEEDRHTDGLDFGDDQ